jgi:hypothetical protein
MYIYIYIYIIYIDGFRSQKSSITRQNIVTSMEFIYILWEKPVEASTSHVCLKLGDTPKMVVSKRGVMTNYEILRIPNFNTTMDGYWSCTSQMADPSMVLFEHGARPNLNASSELGF